MFSLALLATALAVPPALAARSAAPHAPHAAAARDGSHAATAAATRRVARNGPVRSAQRELRRQSRAPRLPDADSELLPAPRFSHAFQFEPVVASPRAACLAAARRAERIHGLPDGLLVAVALSESGLHAHALNIGGRTHFPESPGEARALLAGAPRGASVMAGCVQVNARVHARGSDWPLDAERSADWAGGLLRRWHGEAGGWAEALARWHGGSPASTRRVLCRVRAKLEVASPGSQLLSDLGCAGDAAMRDRRNGEALLSVAELPAP